jgi:hypothetical protein
LSAPDDIRADDAGRARKRGRQRIEIPAVAGEPMDADHGPVRPVVAEHDIAHAIAAIRPFDIDAAEVHFSSC